MIKEVLDTMISPLAEEGMTNALRDPRRWAFAQAVANAVIFMDQGQIIELERP